MNVFGDYTQIAHQTFAVDGLSALSIEMRHESVEVTVYDGADIVVTQLARGNVNAARPFMYQLNEGCLMVASPYTGFQLKTLLLQEKYTVLLPSGAVQRLKAASLSGKVSLVGSGEWQTLALTSKSGSVAAPGELRAQTVELTSLSGSVRAGAVMSGSYVLTSTSGSVHAEQVSGNGTASSISGSVRLGAVSGDRLLLKSTSGSVRVDALSGSGTLSSVSGSVHVAVTQLDGDLVLKSTSGSVRASFARSVSGWLNASSVSGSVRSDLPLKGQFKRSSFTGGLGDNPIHSITAKSIGGSVHLEAC